jgi:8-amino-7-oxononanoate synthase
VALNGDQKPFKLIVTDGVFSMDGDLAPVKALLQIAEEFDALVLIDDAHGFGVLGKQGHGIFGARKFEFRANHLYRHFR